MDDVPLPLGLPELTSSEDEYPVHPAAEAFRMHSEEELETLREAPSEYQAPVPGVSGACTWSGRRLHLEWQAPAPGVAGACT